MSRYDEIPLTHATLRWEDDGRLAAYVDLGPEVEDDAFDGLQYNDDRNELFLYLGDSVERHIRLEGDENYVQLDDVDRDLDAVESELNNGILSVYFAEEQPGQGQE